MHTISPHVWRDPAIWRIAVLQAGFLLPPAFAFVGAVRAWKRKERAPHRNSLSPIILGAAVFVNWLLLAVFIATEQIGGVGVNYHISRFSIVLLVFSLAILLLSLRASSFRAGLFVANFLLLTMWFSIAYAPQHWLERLDIATVKVDDYAVPGAMYIGNPTQSEAEAIAIVHVPGVGDYFLDFGEETFRTASKHEFVTLPFGAWTWRTMSRGDFRAPLPFRNVNEYRIPLSGGRVLTVAF